MTEKKHVSAYRGERVAVDGYCWLHRAAYTCAAELAEGRPCDKWQTFVADRARLLLSAGIEPTVVFDGARLPAKGGEEAKRRLGRQEALANARRHAAMGNYGAADAAYQKAVDITPAMAHAAIKVLARLGVKTVVAPYEADAQMAFLERTGEVSAIITEDSDLVGGYCCQRVFFKMDKQGWGEELRIQTLGNSRSLRMQYFTEEMLRQMCVLAGCDFLPSVRNCGLKTAHKYISRCKRWQKAVQIMRLEGFVFPPNYEVDFQKALWTFKHQLVFDSRQQCGVHLTELPPELEALAVDEDDGGSGGGEAAAGAGAAGVTGAEDTDTQPPFDSQGSRGSGGLVPAMVTDLDFLGPRKLAATLRGIASGHLDPMTHQPFAPDTAAKAQPSYRSSASLPKAFAQGVPTTVAPSGGGGMPIVRATAPSAPTVLASAVRAPQQARAGHGPPAPQPRMAPPPRNGGHFLAAAAGGVRSGGLSTLPIGRDALRDFAFGGGGRLTRPSQNAMRPFKPPASSQRSASDAKVVQPRPEMRSKFFSGLKSLSGEQVAQVATQPEEAAAADQPEDCAGRRDDNCIEQDERPSVAADGDDLVGDSDDEQESEGAAAPRLQGGWRARASAEAVAKRSLDKLEARLAPFRNAPATGKRSAAAPAGKQRTAPLAAPKAKRPRAAAANFDTFRMGH